LQWIWLGLDPIEQEDILSRISSSTHSRSSEQWLDTVIGYRPGNWAYEWTKNGMMHQKASDSLTGNDAAEALYKASLCFSIAGYPHIKGDNLALQSQVLSHQAYQDASRLSEYPYHKLEVPYQGKTIKCNLHLPKSDGPHAVVIASAGLDSLQSDMWRIFRKYFAPENIAMLTVDMPSIGQSNHWPLTEDSCSLHQAILDYLPDLPWVNHHKVGLLGFRFGGNALVRLSFIEQNRIKGAVVVGAPVHHIFSSPKHIAHMPKMYLDVLASRIGKDVVDIDGLSAQMMAWSLKTQGFLSSRRTKVPILAMSLEGDPVAPHSDNQMVATFSQYGKAKKIPSDNLSKGYETFMNEAINWLKGELGR
jgi:esterase FrsA